MSSSFTQQRIKEGAGRSSRGNGSTYCEIDDPVGRDRLHDG
jgi:hypothetical protein